MRLTQRERDIVELLRAEPLLDAAALAERIGSTKAAVSVHLSNLTKKGAVLGRGYVVRPEAQSVVVVGGVNMDIKAHSRGAVQLRTSNPGTARTSPGGVGRNIAENLARLGSPTHLVAAIGRDAFGEQVTAMTRAAGVMVDHLVVGDDPTGTYLAVMDANGELLVAVADMAAAESLTVAQLGAGRDLVARADLLVLDGNIPPDVCAWLLDIAATAGVPVVMDPVSVAKARHLATTLSPQRPLLALTPNHDELESVVGGRVEPSRAGILRAARKVHDLGVEHVWVRRGTRGSVLSSRAEDGRESVVTISAPATRPVDVTGAGDSMTAGFVHALLRGDSPVEAARFGQVTAALTVASLDTVRPDLSTRLVEAELRRTSLGRPQRAPATATKEKHR